MLDENGKPRDRRGHPFRSRFRGCPKTCRGRRWRWLTSARRGNRASFRQGKFRDVKLARQHAAKLENVFEQKGEVKVLALIIKAAAPIHEALTHARLQRLSTDEVRLISSTAGWAQSRNPTLTLRLASKAVVIGFNSRADAVARKVIASTGVDVRYYSIIDEAVDEIKAALSGMMAPSQREYHGIA